MRAGAHLRARYFDGGEDVQEAYQLANKRISDDESMLSTRAGAALTANGGQYFA